MVFFFGLAVKEIVIGLTAAIGFTVALFFATAAFPPGEMLQQAKLGALFSLSAAASAPLAAWMLGSGRSTRATMSASSSGR